MAFFGSRDFELFQSFNEELINNFIETSVILFRVDVNQSERNMYGESVGGKTYLTGIQVNALIDRTDQISNYEGVGSDTNQSIDFRFLRRTLVEKSFKPLIGDIIKFNLGYFEVSNIIDNQLVAGSTDFKHSIICQTVLRRASSLNIEGLN